MTPDRASRFSLRELLGIANLQVVSQDSGAWIDIRILRHRADELSDGGSGQTLAHKLQAEPLELLAVNLTRHPAGRKRPRGSPSTSGSHLRRITAW